MADQDENLLSESNKNRCVKDLTQITPMRLSKSMTSQAAVLIPLIELPSDNKDSGGVGLLYTKRSAKLSSHSREVCFPGGKLDNNETPIQALCSCSAHTNGIGCRYFMCNLDFLRLSKV